jgi:hypothetical protein
LKLLVPLLLSALSSPSPVGGVLLASLRVLSPDAEYSVQVWERPDRPLDRFLTISCVAQCKSAEDYHEEVSDFPLSLTSTEDGALVATIWSGATSLFVRVYRIRHGSIGKVLETFSKAPPLVKELNNGDLLITTYQTGSRQGSSTVHPVARLWHVRNGSRSDTSRRERRAIGTIR